MPTTRARGTAALLFVALACPGASAQPTADQQADALLNAGRKAYNEGNPQFAAERFTELLTKFGGYKNANAARYGLGLALLDLPDRNYQKALDAFLPPAGDGQFPDQGLALYHAGACQRGLGQKELAEAAAKPNELPQRTQNANAKFDAAAKLFVQAREVLEKKAPADADWAGRARCDTAEMELRVGKVKEARATVEPFLKDAKFAKSKLQPLALYYHGTASFLLNDVPSAAKSLNQLAPFDQPYGPHARYLMGRVHSSQGENAEAAVEFDAVLAEYAKQKAAAVEALKQPDRFKNDPFEKTRLETLVKNPAPDYVAGSAFFGACLNYESGKFGDALGKFQAFTKDYATSPLKDDAQLRTGFCQAQLKQFDEAVKSLQPLANHARLADQALFWTGKAQAGLAAAVDPANPNLKTQTFNTAINTLRTASDKANQGNAEAKARRAEYLLELADTQLTAQLAKDAANTYETVWNEKLLPSRAEEILQRLITAYHLAGDIPKSEERIAVFKQQFPNSPLTSLVLFRAAENAYTKAEALVKQNKPAEAKAAFAAAATKYSDVVAKFPEFERVNRAKYGLALCFTAVEDWEKAAKALEAIPAAERTGELSPAAYVLADCLIRTAPAKAEDALQDNMLREKLGAAVGLLDAFVAANPKAEQTPDAILKLGYCNKRLAIQLQPGNERNEALQKARVAFEKLGNEFKQSPLVGTATLERAKVLALQGDKGNAINSLRGFNADPLQKSPVAPLAMIYLGTLLREQNQAAEAAKSLAEARQKFEGGLNAAGGAKAEWVALLRFHHGVALSESNKPGEARAAFEQAAQAAPALPIAVEATLKATQRHLEEVKAKIATLEKQKVPNLKPDQIAAIDNQIKGVKADLANVGKLFEQRAEQYRQAHPQSEARARLLYDAAWAYRGAGTDPAQAYTKLLEQFGDLSLAVEARLELAELVSEKKPDDAIKLLKEAIDKEPTDKPTSPETIDRIRIRLGAALFEKKDYPAAQGQFDAVGNNDKSPHRAHGLYRSAECFLALGKPDEAQKKLVIFRDNAAFHNIAGVSDRALLRLGHALTQLKQWDAARQAFETVLARYGNNGTWAVDARYGIGWAFQNQNRFDDAVNAYALVTQATQDDRAARSHLQIGLCRAAASKWADAGKAFSTVYFGYDLPDLKFPAMLEHARTLGEEKKPDEAVKLLERVIKDAPKDSEWAKAAQERLGKLKKK
ncbi:tetratricopeptide repeat protein [Gemmata sp. G18]|uniref:Tetratricopeptide repeat protein n=1 Tax=Gemmata palustris TaxID=2822762 RepID=A0ABS5BZI1_9BACT|nr:tetratricopeptide repeat protein [Gemmata palustris]MBP3959136.1 tetratricopeptide repeat protein [Gemmata palustris]